jgi:hypothetical protein
MTASARIRVSSENRAYSLFNKGSFEVSVTGPETIDASYCGANNLGQSLISSAAVCNYYEIHGFVLRGRVEQHPGYFGCLYDLRAPPLTDYLRG